MSRVFWYLCPWLNTCVPYLVWIIFQTNSKLIGFFSSVKDSTHNPSRQGLSSGETIFCFQLSSLSLSLSLSLSSSTFFFSSYPSFLSLTFSFTFFPFSRFFLIFSPFYKSHQPAHKLSSLFFPFFVFIYIANELPFYCMFFLFFLLSSFLLLFLASRLGL